MAWLANNLQAEIESETDKDQVQKDDFIGLFVFVVGSHHSLQYF